MEKIKEINTITKLNETTKKDETITTIKTYTKKSWDDLSLDEKKEEIEKNQEQIYSSYQDGLFYIFEDELESTREQFKEILFDNVYVDGNSQGSWIDKIQNLRYNFPDLTIFGHYVHVYDIDLTIRKYIENITADDVDIEIGDYGCEFTNGNYEDKIKTSKKYVAYVNNIVNEVNEWITWINDACKELINKEYYTPSDLEDPDDADYLENYFDGCEFIKDEKTETKKEVL